MFSHRKIIILFILYLLIFGFSRELAALDNANFTPYDIVVSDINDSLLDPEFDKNLTNLRMAWQERSGDLWETDVDSFTGSWNPLNGRQLLVDTDLVVIGKTRQGPEWAYDNCGNRLVYTRKMKSGQYQLYQAWWDPITRQFIKSPVMNGENQALYQVSHDLGDPTPRIIYSYPNPNSITGHTMAFGWREINDPKTDTHLPIDFKSVQWISGQRTVVATTRINGIRQVVYYNIDTGITTIATSDPTHKRFPLIWQDPATQEYILSAVMDDTGIGVWRQKSQDQWVFTNYLRPPTEIPYIFKPDWFVWNGASYLAYLIHTEKSGKLQNYQGKGEVWVTCVSNINCQFTHRQVNNPTITRIKDVENLVVNHTVYVYYAEILPDQRRLIHRTDTGL